MRIVIAAAVILCACSPSLQSGGSTDVALTVAPTTVTARDSVVLTLTNSSAQDVGYNLCTSGIQHRAADVWHDVQTNRVCTMELRTLQPGQSATFAATLPTGIAAGEYRFHTTVEVLAEGTRRDVSSNVVRVTS